MEDDQTGLQYLLDLDGEAFALSPSHFVSFKAQKVAVRKEVPHGIKYALNLFDETKHRVIGFDNAHGFKEHRRVEWDHLHKQEKVYPYRFKTAGQLLEDFWAEVNQFLEKQP
ncbi:MAG: DUF6516 family protein [bacterium]|nr:DUF6516 family protein [bacterium]